MSILMQHGLMSGINQKSTFLFLNNCNEKNAYNGLKSLVGNDLNPSDLTSEYFSLVDSPNFNNEKYAYMNTSAGVDKGISCNFNFANYANYLTFETYFTNAESYVYAGWQYVNNMFAQVARDSNDGKLRFELRLTSEQNISYYNGAYKTASYGNLFYVKTTQISSQQIHVAYVFDISNSNLYCYVNGLIQYRCTLNINLTTTKTIKIEQGEQFSTFGIEFVSLRNGDFSNNLESFTVPTSKYHL